MTQPRDGIGPAAEHGIQIARTKPFADGGHTLPAARYDNGFWIKMADGTYRNATRRLVRMQPKACGPKSLRQSNSPAMAAEMEAIAKVDTIQSSLSSGGHEEFAAEVADIVTSFLAADP